MRSGFYLVSVVVHFCSIINCRLSYQDQMTLSTL